jgi:hypothetical protein
VTVSKPVASSTFIIPRLDPTKLGPPQSTQKKTTPTKGKDYASPFVAVYMCALGVRAFFSPEHTGSYLKSLQDEGH